MTPLPPSWHPRWRWLLNPKTTIGAIVGGLVSLSATLAAVVGALTPLTGAPIDAVRQYLFPIITWLTVASAFCMGLAGVGRSVAAWVDWNGHPENAPPNA